MEGPKILILFHQSQIQTESFFCIPHFIGQNLCEIDFTNSRTSDVHGLNLQEMGNRSFRFALKPYFQGFDRLKPKSLEVKDQISTRERWLETGYRHFAEDGPNQLSINQLSREVGASRASFYHHFGDIEIFTAELLEMHQKVCTHFDLEAKKSCKNLVPDLYSVLARYPLGLRFNLQLFHHRDVPAFNYLFSKTFKASAHLFILDLFVRHFELDTHSEDLYNLWLTLGESWYSRLNPDDLSEEALLKHSTEILDTMKDFIQSDLYRKLR
jgi:AcrR family transcriptional regulator